MIRKISEQITKNGKDRDLIPLFAGDLGQLKTAGGPGRVFFSSLLSLLSSLFFFFVSLTP
jgi:hypothetical protein